MTTKEQQIGEAHRRLAATKEKLLEEYDAAIVDHALQEFAEEEMDQ